MAEQLGEIFTVFLILRQVLNQFLAFFRYMLNVLKVGSSQILTDQFDLILGIGARQERLPLEHLSEDATDTPHINGSGVLGSTEQQFRGPIPASSHVLGQHISLDIFKQRPGEPEITDFKIAVRIN